MSTGEMEKQVACKLLLPSLELRADITNQSSVVSLGGV